jgi:hypothetical protein
MLVQTVAQAGIDIYGLSALYPTQKSEDGPGAAPAGTRTITGPKTGLQTSVAPKYAPPAAKALPPPANIYGLQANLSPSAPMLRQPNLYGLQPNYNAPELRTLPTRY